MASSYPSSAKTFTPLVDNVDYPQATQVNQVYEELTAIEQSLLGGLTHKLNIANNNAYFSEYDNGNSGTALTVNFASRSNKQKVTLTGNCTFTFTAPNGPCNVLLRVLQDATGSRTVTWPATVKWPAGTAPTLTTTASLMDLVAFYYDGTNFYGSASLNFTP